MAKKSRLKELEDEYEVYSLLSQLCDEPFYDSEGNEIPKQKWRVKEVKQYVKDLDTEIKKLKGE